MVASQRVADTLRKRILSGALTPGTRIMQEEVAESLGSSRLPVREALRILAAEGLVVIKPNSGAWVSKMDLAECQATYKLRERVEPLALTESLPNLTSEDFARLDEIQSEIESNQDVDHFLALDAELHLITYSGCRNDQLLTMVRRFWNTTQHYRRAYARLINPSGYQLINHEHRLIIEAIKRGDPVDAERFLEGHIRRTRLALSRHPELFLEE
ncbi:GntR family transcriptional regulator [Streptomyces sp. NBC_01716]|uniref:GntR family transcriptional regulator n=1 Tax=Streptomyces sp. NBC_01716 TaxID=2975917 RepID=UPI002E33FDC1|nr:GntR family transcriptional regulator [Streptomyces sp. NBC_01716]